MFQKNKQNIPILALAPMAGYTNPEFRLLALNWGADIVYSEMVSGRGLVFGGQRTFDLMDRRKGEKNLIIQIFGDDPSIMGEAAEIVSSYKTTVFDDNELEFLVETNGEADGAVKVNAADGIDINFGCPVKKIAKSGSGAVLLKDPEKALAITEAVVKHSSVPVSIKFRLGWNSELPAARDFLDIAKDCNCSHVMIHGRWATQFYSGKADWQALAELTEYSKVPVFVNGDVCTANDGLDIFRQTGAAGIGIGRGALKKPWIFRDIKSAFGEESANGVEPLENTNEYFTRRVAIARWMLRKTAQRLLAIGAKTTGRCRSAPAYLRLRSHFMALISSIHGASKVRTAILKAESNDELDQILAELETSNRFIPLADL